MNEIGAIIKGFDFFYVIGMCAAFALGYVIRGIVERVRQNTDKQTENRRQQDDADSNIG